MVGMVDREKYKRAIMEEFRKLSHGAGVQRDRLRDAMSARLRRLFDIWPDDSPRLVRMKVTWFLEQLIARLESDNQCIARYSFNLTGKPEIEALNGVVQRREAIPGKSRSWAEKRMADKILPELADHLMSDPPGPMPES